MKNNHLKIATRHSAFAAASGKKFLKALLTTALLLCVNAMVFAQQDSGAIVSTDGLFSLRIQSSVSNVPTGGGSVTYTYTIKNLKNQKLFYISGADNKCSPLTQNQAFSSEQGWGRTVYYIPNNGTVTWTCTSTVTETTTSTSQFQFARDHGSTGLLFLRTFNWIDEDEASASVTVTRDLPAGALSCNTLWYSTIKQSSPALPGEVGILNTTTGGHTTQFNIDDQIAGTTLVGSSAMAVDPENPTQIYYVPRNINAGTTYGGLYRYNVNTNVSTELANATNTPDAVRLSVGPNGLVWTIDGAGIAYSFNPNTNAWTNRGTVLLPSPYLWANLGSGDLTMDGNGTMYMVASDSATSVGTLFTIVQTELLDGSPQAKLVGGMGSGSYSGIGFTEDGNLWASTFTVGETFTRLYKINIATGVASSPVILDGLAVTDLGSCALPKPLLNATNVVTSVDGVISGGSVLTYSINICNNGSLASTNTTFTDAIPAGTTYVPNSTTQNGVAVADIGGAMPYLTATKVSSTGEAAGSINFGECAIITFKVTVNNSFAGTEICNQGSVDYTYNANSFLTDDPSVSGGSDPTCVSITNPVIAIAKSAPITTSITTPQNVTYTYNVTNVGTDVLTTVNVSGDKCTTFTYISGDTNTDGKLQIGETWVYQCTSYITANTTNVATATAKGELTDKTTTATDNWTITIPAGVAALTVNKTASPVGFVTAGSTIDYTIVVTNTGTTDATAVTLNDVLPTGVTYVANSAQKKYEVTTTGSVTKNLPQTDFNSGSKAVNVAFATTDGIPAGATLTNINFTINGQSFSHSGWFESDAQRDDVSMVFTAPGGTPTSTIATGSFGAASSGTWTSINRNLTATGSAIGTYAFDFNDNTNQTDTENRVANTSSITITWTNTVATTNAALAPTNMVTAANAIKLQPGKTLTVTFKGLVGASLAADTVLTNTATANGTGVFGPATGSVVNTVYDVCKSGASKNGSPTASDADGDGINDSCDLDDDNDGILDTVECTATTPVQIIFWTTNGNKNSGIPGSSFNVQTGYESIAGAGVTTTVNGGSNNYLEIIGAGESNFTGAITNNDYVEYSFKTNSVYGILTSIGNYSPGATGAPQVSYQYQSVISSDNFATSTILHAAKNNLFVPTTTVIPVDPNYSLLPNTTYKIRVYFYNVTGGATATFASDDFRVFAYKECDNDGDGIPNRLDLDTDNDGCADASEYYGTTTPLSTTVDGNGKIVGASYTSTTATNVTTATNSTVTTQPVDKSVDAGSSTTFTVAATSLTASTFLGSPTFAPNFTSGTTDNSSNLSYLWEVSTNDGSTWTSLTNTGIYSGTTTSTLTLTGITTEVNNYQYRALVSVSNNVCANLNSEAATLKIKACYKPAVLDAEAGNTLGTNLGISSLNRTALTVNNWPKVRESGWIALESKTKGFVLNRVKFADGIPVAADGVTPVITSPVEGMMVYDTTENCLKVYTTTNGTDFAWYCMETQTCPE